MYSFSYLEPVCCSMSSSKCCFLACIQISQEAGQVVWYSHLFQNFPQFIVIHRVKVNKAQIDVFLELSYFFNDPTDIGNLISDSSSFSKSSLLWQSFMTLYRRQGSRASPQKRNEKNKMSIWGVLTNSCEKKRSEKQRRKGKIYPFEFRVPKNSKER